QARPRLSHPPVVVVTSIDFAFLRRGAPTPARASRPLPNARSILLSERGLLPLASHLLGFSSTLSRARLGAALLELGGPPELARRALVVSAPPGRFTRRPACRDLERDAGGATCPRARIARLGGFRGAFWGALRPGLRVLHLALVEPLCLELLCLRCHRSL